jgi:hypothetical protein
MFISLGVSNFVSSDNMIQLWGIKRRFTRSAIERCNIL